MVHLPLLLFRTALAAVILAPSPLLALMITPIDSTPDPFDLKIYWGPGVSDDPWVGIAIWDPIELENGDYNYSYVGGFISIRDMDSFLQVRFARSDTNGNYGPEAIDWFDIPVGTSTVAPKNYDATFASHWYTHGWGVEALTGTRNGLRIFGRDSPSQATVPEGGATFALLGISLAGLIGLHRRFGPRERS